VHRLTDVARISFFQATAQRDSCHPQLYVEANVHPSLLHTAVASLFANAHLTPEQGLAAIDKCRTIDGAFEPATLEEWMGQLAQRFPEHETLKVHRLQLLLESGQSAVAAELLESRT
jgi:hypothetical protein